MTYHELVRTVVTPPLRPQWDSDEEVVVRIEVFKDSEAFYPTVWFQESFRLRPSSPTNKDGRPPQAETEVDQLYLQDTLGFEELRGDSDQEVVKKVLRRIDELFVHWDSDDKRSGPDMGGETSVPGTIDG